MDITVAQNDLKKKAVTKMGRLSQMMRWMKRSLVTMASTWQRTHPPKHLSMPGIDTLDWTVMCASIMEVEV